MDSRFVTPLVLPIALISLFAIPQTSWAGCRYDCVYTPRGPRGGSILPVELVKIEDLIDKGNATAYQYRRAGEIYAEIGDNAMAKTRLNQARNLYRDAGNIQGIKTIDRQLLQLRVQPTR